MVLWHCGGVELCSCGAVVRSAARWDEVITFIISLGIFLSACLPLLLLAGGSWLVVAGGDHFSSVSDRRRDWARLWTNAIRLTLTCDGIN